MHASVLQLSRSLRDGLRQVSMQRKLVDREGRHGALPVHACARLLLLAWQHVACMPKALWEQWSNFRVMGYLWQD